jgi:hypothetical protein
MKDERLDGGKKGLADAGGQAPDFELAPRRRVFGEAGEFAERQPLLEAMRGNRSMGLEADDDRGGTFFDDPRLAPSTFLTDRVNEGAQEPDEAFALLLPRDAEVGLAQYLAGDILSDEELDRILTGPLDEAG